MKKTKYVIEEEIEPKVFLLYNTFSNYFALINQEKHDLWGEDCEKISYLAPHFYQELVDKGFIIENELDELETIKYRKNLMQQDSRMYQIMVNTTLDCNLSCWYCYEKKKAGSRLDNETIQTIKKNIVIEYENERYSSLKISFFGGEPFMDFSTIRNILNYANCFCKENNIQLIADFTTNATLITPQYIDYLKHFQCHFQITLDGTREIHNTIKKNILNPLADSYGNTIEALKLINKNIPNRWVAVRINFDNRILHHIKEILDDIAFLTPQSTYIILKKIWQIKTEIVDKKALICAIQEILKRKYILDYYLMPKGSVCFAERRRMALFNYDGKIFKCSTITFDENETLGRVDKDTGVVTWHTPKIIPWFKDELQNECKKCKWLPVCLGPCNKQKMLYKDKFICTFDAMNLNAKEYLIYLFKCHLVRNEIYNPK